MGSKRRKPGKLSAELRCFQNRNSYATYKRKNVATRTKPNKSNRLSNPNLNSRAKIDPIQLNSTGNRVTNQPQLPEIRTNGASTGTGTIPACSSQSWPLANSILSLRQAVQVESFVAMRKWVEEIKIQNRQVVAALKAEIRQLKKERTPRKRKAYSNLSPRSQQRVTSEFKANVDEFCAKHLLSGRDEMLRSLLPPQFIQDLTPEQTLYLQLKLGLSNNLMNRLRRELSRMGRNIFASKGSVAAARNTTPIQLDSTKLSDECTLVAVTNIRECLQYRLNLLLARGENIDDTVDICIQTDKGGISTKGILALGPCEKRNSPNSAFLIWIYNGEEKREYLDPAFDQLRREFANDRTIMLDDGRERQLKFYMTGDLKCMKIVQGLKASTIGKTCLLCDAPYKATIKDMIDVGAGTSRSSNINAEIAQMFDPLIPFVSYGDIFIPVLHLVMGITSILIKALITSLWSEERTFRGATNFTFTDIASPAELEEMAVLKQREKDLEEKVDQWTEIMATIAEGEVCEAGNTSDACGLPTCLVRKYSVQMPNRETKLRTEVASWKQMNGGIMVHTICMGWKVEKAKMAQRASAKMPKAVNQDTVIEAMKDEVNLCMENILISQSKQEKLRESMEKNMATIRRESIWTNLLFKVFEKMGAYEQAFFQQFTGNHVRQMLKHAFLLRDGLVDPDTGKNLCDFEKVENAVTAFELLGEIQNLTVARMLTTEEITKLEEYVHRFRDHLKTHFASELPGHKLHILLFHMADFAKNRGSVGFFSEQCIESFHAVVNALTRRFCYHSFEDQSAAILKHCFQNNVFYDKFEGIL